MKVENIYNCSNDIVGKMEVHHLNFTEEKSHKVILVNAFISQYQDIQMSPFNQNEISILNGYSIDKKRNEFILGRYSMKTAISHFSNTMNKHDVEVEYGILNYPIIKDNVLGIEVGLTHCNSRAIAMAYSNRIMLGIDIEQVDENRIDLLDKIALPQEKELYHGVALEYDAFLTLLWTAKEALSKAIKTGFTCDMDIFQIRSIKYIQNAYLVEYVHFPAFQGVVKVKEDYIVTLAYIKKLDISSYIKAINA